MYLRTFDWYYNKHIIYIFVNAYTQLWLLTCLTLMLLKFKYNIINFVKVCVEMIEEDIVISSKKI